MEDNVPTAELLAGTRAAMDKVQRSYRQWRGSIGDDVAGARETLAAIEELQTQAAALGWALVAFIEERAT